MREKQNTKKCKEMNRASETCRTIMKELTFVPTVPEGEVELKKIFEEIMAEKSS